MDPDAAALVRDLGLQPIPVEGGWFRRTWLGPDAADGHPIGTAIIAMFTNDSEGFSAFHRLAATEVWHFYRGDPFVLTTLHPDGTVVAHDLGSEHQVVVPAATWMGGHVADGGRWSLVGTTMAPGFTDDGFELGDRPALLRGWPDAARTIIRLTRA
jgi:uncharacterized protein